MTTFLPCSLLDIITKTLISKYGQLRPLLMTKIVTDGGRVGKNSATSVGRRTIARDEPMPVLVAMLLAFGRLSSDSASTAFKTSGVSLYQVFLPVVFFSGLCYLATILLVIHFVAHKLLICPSF